jgi:protein SCO1/2
MKPLDRARRSLLMAGASWCASRAGRVEAHEAMGIIDPPRTAPACEVLTSEGRTSTLESVLRGNVTAMQLMFTGCSATCPISGALFADLQKRLMPAAPRLRLLSVSIDPVGDTIDSMRDWLRRFGARPDRWVGVLSKAAQLDGLLDFVDGRNPGVDRHTSQFYLFDTLGRLTFRTAPMPRPDSVRVLLEQIATRL